MWKAGTGLSQVTGKPCSIQLLENVRGAERPTVSEPKSADIKRLGRSNAPTLQPHTKLGQAGVTMFTLGAREMAL